MTPFCYHYSEEWDPVVRSAVVLNSSPAEKRHLRPHTENQLWLMLRSVRACNVLQQQPLTGRPGSMASNTARRYVLLRRLCPADKRTQGFMDDILTFDNINTLLLMDYSVLLPSHSVRCLRMKCYPLINWAVPLTLSSEVGGLVKQQKGNVNIYLLITAGSSVWTSNLMTWEALIWRITWRNISFSAKNRVAVLQNTCKTWTFNFIHLKNMSLNPNAIVIWFMISGNDFFASQF